MSYMDFFQAMDFGSSLKYVIRHGLSGSLLDSKNKCSPKFGAQVDTDFQPNPRESVLKAGGKPSTWFPPGGLEELLVMSTALSIFMFFLCLFRNYNCREYHADYKIK